jgi:phosphotransferase system HPr (HPr) family protein
VSIRANVVVQDPIGLHARPAGQIVKLVKESGLEVLIGPEGGEMVKANSPLRMMAMKAKTGDVLSVEIETEDAAVAEGIISQIQDFLKG